MGTWNGLQQYDLDRYLGEINAILGAGYHIIQGENNLTFGCFPFERNSTIGATYMDWEQRQKSSTITIANKNYYPERSTSWGGKFAKLSSNNNLYVLTEGTPPVHILERIDLGATRLMPAKALVFDDHVTLLWDTGSVDIDIKGKNFNIYNICYSLPLTELGLPIMVVGVDWNVSKPKSLVRISNHDTNIIATGALIDRENHLLVAAQFVETVVSSTKAVMASLMTNSRSKDTDRWVQITGKIVDERSDSSDMVYSAKRGYHKKAMSHLSTGINIKSVFVSHPGCTSVLKDEGCFYILDLPGYDVPVEEQFVHRLNMAQVNPLLIEWGEQLFNEGLSRSVIKPLTKYGEKDGICDGWAVNVDPISWKYQIEYLLNKGKISVPA